MNAKVVLTKANIEKTLEIRDNYILTKTRYKTSFDAEGVYSGTKVSLRKKGWKMKPAAVFSKIENMPRREKTFKFLGRRVRNNGTVGE